MRRTEPTPQEKNCPNCRVCKILLWTQRLYWQDDCILQNTHAEKSLQLRLSQKAPLYHCSSELCQDYGPWRGVKEMPRVGHLLCAKYFMPVIFSLVEMMLGLPSELSRLRICLQCRRAGFDSWIGKIHWSRKWQPTSEFLPGEFCGQRSLAGYSRRHHESWTRQSD